MALAVIGPQYIAPHTMDLTIVRKGMILARGDLEVADGNGNLVLKVKEKMFAWDGGKKYLVDPLGNTIVTFRPKAMTLHSRCEVFRGESTDEKDLIFTAKTHSMFNIKPILDVFLANNTAQEACDFQVKGSYSDRSCTVFAGDASSNALVAQMHKKHTAGSIFVGNDNFMVTIYPNVDYAFVVALIVILDDINHKIQQSRRAHETAVNLHHHHVVAANHHHHHGGAFM